MHNSLKWSLKCNSDGHVLQRRSLGSSHVCPPPELGGGRNALRAQAGSSPLLYHGNAYRKFSMKRLNQLSLGEGERPLPAPDVFSHVAADQIFGRN